jgi:hypothetical protein
MVIRWRSLGPSESGCGADRKGWIVIIIENGHNTRPAAGHLLNAPMGCHQGWKAILKSRRYVSRGVLWQTRPAGLDVRKNSRSRQTEREGKVRRAREKRKKVSRSLLATLGDTANAPAALERCLSSASCNKSTTLDPKSAPCLSTSTVA